MRVSAYRGVILDIMIQSGGGGKQECVHIVEPSKSTEGIVVTQQNPSIRKCT